MGKSKKSDRKAQATAPAPDGILATITNAVTLLAALITLTAPASTILGTRAWASMYRTISGGHVNKRGLFIASIVTALDGDGSIASLDRAERDLAVMPLRAEVAYAVATGDFAYFKKRDGAWCGWAAPIMRDGAPSLDATDDQYAAAFAKTCPTNPANVGGMLAEVTLTATKRNVTPVPVFADTVKYGKVALFDPADHGADGYQSKAYGTATFTLTA